CRVPVAGCRVRRGRELGAGARCWLPGAGVAVRAMAYGRTPWLYRQRVLAYAIRRLGGPARRRAAGVGAGRRGMPGGWRLGGPARRRRVGVGAGRRGVPGGRRRDRPARAPSPGSGGRGRCGAERSSCGVVAEGSTTRFLPATASGAIGSPSESALYRFEPFDHGISESPIATTTRPIAISQPNTRLNQAGYSL